MSEKKCELCNSSYGFLNKAFKLNDGHEICSKCQNQLGMWYKPKLEEYKSVPFEDVKNKYENKEETEEETEEEKTAKNILCCPYCDSTNVDFVQNNRKNFSVGKAVGGAVLTGGIGTLAGFTGKKGMNQWHCKDCGRTFETK